MGNNELSGPVLTTYLADIVKKMRNRKYTYRFVFAPENLGAITYIHKNLKKLKKDVVAAFNVTCVGDNKNILLYQLKMKILFQIKLRYIF